MTLATANAETITNAHHTVDITYLGGAVAFTTDGGGVLHDTPPNGGVPDANEPYNQFLEPAVAELHQSRDAVARDAGGGIDDGDAPPRQPVEQR